MKRYIVATAIGLVLTRYAHQAATISRGYKAVGGEMFILPLILMAAYALSDYKLIKELKQIFIFNGKWD